MFLMEGNKEYELFLRQPLGHTPKGYDCCQFIISQVDEANPTKKGLSARDLDGLIGQAVEKKYLNLEDCDAVKTIPTPYVTKCGTDCPVPFEMVRYFVDKYKRKFDEQEDIERQTKEDEEFWAQHKEFFEIED